jgi:hypothetical protein
MIMIISMVYVSDPLGAPSGRYYLSEISKNDKNNKTITSDTVRYLHSERLGYDIYSTLTNIIISERNDNKNCV